MGKRIFTLVQFCLLATFACVGAESPEKPRLEPAFLANVRQLTLEGRRSGEGYFSPDGKQLIFQSEREPGNPFYQIYILDLESGDTHRVSPGTGKTTCGFFRPGSDQVLFASTHWDPKARQKQKAELDFRASARSAAIPGITTNKWTSFPQSRTERKSATLLSLPVTTRKGPGRLTEKRLFFAPCGMLIQPTNFLRRTKNGFKPTPPTSAKSTSWMQMAPISSA